MNIKLVIIPSRVKKNGECVIYVQIPKDRKTAWIPTNITVLPENFVEGRVVGGKDRDRNAPSKNLRLSEIMTGYERKLLNNEDLVEQLNVLEIKELLLNDKPKADTNFFTFTENRIAELREFGKAGTVAPLTYALDKIKAFHGKPKLDFSEINVRFLQRFEQYGLDNGLKRNTIALVFRYVRSMFNEAIDEFNTNVNQPVILNYPFRKFKIETETTRNRNLSSEIIRKILNYKADSKREEVARDVFMLQFMLFGMNIKDLFYLKHENIVDGRLQFNRFKTNRFYNIKIEPEAQLLIDKYKGEKYLLWFADFCQNERTENSVRHSRKSEFQYKDHHAFFKMINEFLKKIQVAIELSVPTPITTYFARHSFASIMREIGISKDDISLCLGHVAPEQSMKVTGIYINEDFGRADVANRKLIDHVLS